MDMFQIKDLSFSYAGAKSETLQHISINIQEGNFTVLCGPSGCGKTTLLRLLKRELSPVGKLTGYIMYAGKPLIRWDEKSIIEQIGFVFQDPENQIVMDNVMQEIVFGMENLGYSNMEMRKRVAELVHFFGMEHLLTVKPSELSGGQKQMLNLLSVLLLKPKVLLLDEPTSQLDPVAAKDFIIMLERLNKEMGMTIILVEQRLEELFAVADQMILMDKGKLVYQGTSRDVVYSVFQQNDHRFIEYIPSISKLYLKKSPNIRKQDIPLTVKESREWFNGLSQDLELQTKRKSPNPNVTAAELILSLKDVYYQYTKKSPFILKNLSLQIRKGEFFSIVGGNGSGKSTLLKTCIGNLKPQRGRARFLGKDTNKLKAVELSNIAYLPQNPKTFFIHDTIEKEMQEVVRSKSIDNGNKKISDMLDVFGITYLRERHPYDCSGGEIQKAALACMLLGNPQILFIDEPTKGLDPVSKLHFAEIIGKLHREGLTIVMVTHDIEFAAKNAQRCAMMFDGSITVEGTPKDLFNGNYFYTTSINRTTRGSQMKDVLTIEEALQIWPENAPI